MKKSGSGGCVLQRQRQRQSSTCPWRSPELGAAQRHGQPPQRLHRHQGLAGLKSRRRDGGRARGVRRQPPRDPYNLKNKKTYSSVHNSSRCGNQNE